MLSFTFAKFALNLVAFILALPIGGVGFQFQPDLLIGILLFRPVAMQANGGLYACLFQPAVILAFLGRVDIRHAVRAVHHLDGTKTDAYLQRGLDDICRHLLQFQFPLVQYDTFLEFDQCEMVWRRLIHAQSQKVFGRHTVIDISFHLSFT